MSVLLPRVKNSCLRESGTRPLPAQLLAAPSQVNSHDIFVCKRPELSERRKMTSKAVPCSPDRVHPFGQPASQATESDASKLSIHSAAEKWQAIGNADLRDALHAAAEDDHLSAVERLIAHGADVNRRDIWGNTPLHYAAAYTDNNHLVQILANHGAQLSINNRAGLTPMYLAALRNHHGVVAQLITLSPDQSPNYDAAVSSRDTLIQELKKLAAQGSPGMQQIDQLAAHMLATSVAELNQPATLATFLSQLYSRNAPTLGVPSEGWTWEPMLQQRFRAIVASLLQSTPRQLDPANYDKLVTEAACQLETLRLARRFECMEQLTDVDAQQDLVTFEARCITERILSDAEKSEYCVPLSFKQHAVYANFKKRQINSVEVVTVRFDNVGCGALNVPDGRVRPLSFNIPLDDASAHVSHLLSQLIGLHLRDEAPEAVFNGTIYVFLATLHKHYDDHLIDRTNFDGPQFLHKAQRAENCVLKNYSVGMCARLGADLFRWHKFYERILCRKLCFDLAFSEAAFNASQRAEILLRLTTILQEPPIDLKELEHFLNKPGRGKLAANLDFITMRQLIDTEATQAMQTILEHGGDIGCHDTFGTTLLHRAAQRGHLKMVELLLQFGAPLQSPDMFGRTALHAAVELGQQKVADLLTQYGADRFYKDLDGVTPQDIAKKKCRDAQAVLHAVEKND